uniref:Tripartite motif-containing protein 16-like n=1 Tax=Amphiprion percula TaxID=161767 RepID=A0A3P8RXC5_AMPPE
MAQQRDQPNSEKISCSICLDLLKDPVTTSCGHSYCMDCIKTHWDGEGGKRIYSCPQCRKTFKRRPDLQKNILLAELVEELKKTGLQAAANICSRHDKMMEIFCGNDQQLICFLCAMDEHKGHKIVPAAVERMKKQKELEVSRLNIQQRIQDRQKDVKLLQQELEDIRVSADKTVEDSKEMFTEMIRVKEVKEKLEKEIRDLKRKDTEHLEDVTAAVKELRGKLQDILKETWTNISLTITQPDVLLSEPQPEPKTRDEFLKYSTEITLDPNTAHRYVLLSAGNRKATLREQKQRYPDHPDRFTGSWQVLSRESLTGRCYWEVEWSGLGVVVAVAYKNICRKGNSDKCEFGRNDRSWSLRCGPNRYKFSYNNTKTPVSGPRSSRIGVYLDHRAGILSFYSISETMTLLHRVQTTFTEPLHAGVYLFSDGGWLFSSGATAEFLKLR